MKEFSSVSEVMTHAVTAVGSEAPLKEIVEHLQRWKISALPVLAGDGRVIGVVSEADLLAKGPVPGASDEATGTGSAAGGGTAHALGSRPATAGELMSVPAVTVHPEATIAEAGRIMVRGHVKRLPVVDHEGCLRGVVSRSDLLKVYLRPDTDIAEAVVKELVLCLLPADASLVSVQVEDGTVTLSGRVTDGAVIPVLERLAHAVPGVVAVRTLLSAQPLSEGDRPRESGNLAA